MFNTQNRCISLKENTILVKTSHTTNILRNKTPYNLKTKLLYSFIVITFSYLNIYSQSYDYKSTLGAKGDALYELVFGETYNDKIRYIKNKYRTKKYKFTSDQEEKILLKSIKYYSEFLNEKTKKHEYANVNKNLGIINYKLGNYSKSIQIFEEILDLGFENRHFTSIFEHNLIELYILTSQYDKSLKYAKKIKFSNSLYTCGNAENEDKVYHTLTMTKIYNGLKNYEKAIDYGLSEVFNNQLISDGELIKLTSEILKKKYSKPYLLNQLKNSFNNIKKHPKNKDTFILHFLDRKIILGLFSIGNSETIKDLKLYLTKSRFYSEIQN